MIKMRPWEWASSKLRDVNRRIHREREQGYRYTDGRPQREGGHTQA